MSVLVIIGLVLLVLLGLGLWMCASGGLLGFLGGMNLLDVAGKVLEALVTAIAEAFRGQ